jgi:hypothetical protein
MEETRHRNGCWPSRAPKFKEKTLSGSHQSTPQRKHSRGNAATPYQCAMLNRSYKSILHKNMYSFCCFPVEFPTVGHDRVCWTLLTVTTQTRRLRVSQPPKGFLQPLFHAMLAILRWLLPFSVWCGVHNCRTHGSRVLNHRLSYRGNSWLASAFEPYSPASRLPRELS